MMVIKVRRLRGEMGIYSNKVRDAGATKGSLIPFRSGRPDSLVVGDDSILPFLSACTGECDIERGAGVQSAGCSICSEDGGGNYG